MTCVLELLRGGNLRTTLLILSYPGVFFFFTVNPVVRKWNRTHAGTPLPPALQLSAELIGRRLYFVKFALLAALLAGWMRWTGAPPGELVAPTGPLPARLATVLVAAAVLMLARAAFQRSFPWQAGALLGHPLRRGPASLWISIFLVGGVIEETWRALCLMALVGEGKGDALGVLVTSIAFAFAHLSHLPARLSGNSAEALWESILGAALAELFLLHRTIAAPYAAGLCLNLFNLWLLRHGKSRPPTRSGA